MSCVRQFNIVSNVVRVRAQVFPDQYALQTYSSCTRDDDYHQMPPTEKTQ